MDIRDLATLPRDWRGRESPEARAIGTRWLRDGNAGVLRVPSVVIPRESNYLLKPMHPRFDEIEVSAPLGFEFDLRLFGRTR
jgi:RES domain-containing protein